MKNKPVLTKAINNRENASSRARASAKISAGEYLGEAAAIFPTEVATSVPLKAILVPALQLGGKEYCFPDEHADGGPSRTVRGLDIQLGSSRKRQPEL